MTWGALDCCHNGSEKELDPGCGLRLKVVQRDSKSKFEFFVVVEYLVEFGSTAISGRYGSLFLNYYFLRAYYLSFE